MSTGRSADIYGLAATLFTHHPLQIVVTGRADDPAAQALEAAAQRVYRLGKSVLRLTPGASLANFAGALKATLPHLAADKAMALVCAGQTCLPPTSDPQHLTALLENGAAAAATP